MIINKRSVSGNLDLLRFLFSSYELIDENNIPETPIKPAIYCGDRDKADIFIKKYKDNNIDFIVKDFFSNFNLDDRYIILNIIFEKWRHATVPKYLDNILDSIPQNVFNEAVKIKWVSGKWIIKEVEDENTFLTVVDKLNRSKYELIKAYFTCLENNKPYIIESSFITFLLKAKYKNYLGNSFQYKKKLEMYKGNKLEGTFKALEDSLEYNIDNKELRLLNILMNIQNNTKNN